MKRFRLKSMFVVSNVTLLAVVIIIPLICFGVFNAWPNFQEASDVLFWVTFILFPILDVGYVLYTLFRKNSDESTSVIQFALTFAIQFLPIFTYIFTLDFATGTVWFVLPLVIDFIALAAWIVLMIAIDMLGNKMGLAKEALKSEKVEIIDHEEEYNKEDGTFKGSRVKPLDEDKDQ